MFLKLHSAHGDNCEVVINSNMIVTMATQYLSQYQLNSTIIKLIDGNTYNVMENIYKILSMLKGE